jgi:hypothetical protein
MKEVWKEGEFKKAMDSLQKDIEQRKERDGGKKQK